MEDRLHESLTKFHDSSDDNESVNVIVEKVLDDTVTLKQLEEDVVRSGAIVVTKFTMGESLLVTVNPSQLRVVAKLPNVLVIHPNRMHWLH